MEAREEKLLLARASFRNEGSLNYFEPQREKKQELKRGKGMFLFRGLVALILFGVFAYGDSTNTRELNEISRKSYALIQKSEINVEKYSALISRIW